MVEGRDGESKLRARNDHGDMPLILHPEDAAMWLMPHALVSASYPTACLPAPNIARASVARLTLHR